MENLDLEKKTEIKTNTNPNTDPKPHICYFNGDFESIVNHQTHIVILGLVYIFTLHQKQLDLN